MSVSEGIWKKEDAMKEKTRSSLNLGVNHHENVHQWLFASVVLIVNLCACHWSVSISGSPSKVQNVLDWDVSIASYHRQPIKVPYDLSMVLELFIVPMRGYGEWEKGRCVCRGVIRGLMGSSESTVTSFWENEAVKISVQYLSNCLRPRVALVLFRTLVFLCV